MGKKKHSLFEVDISKRFSTGISTRVDWEPSTDIIEVGGNLVLEVELPGVNKDDISIHFENNQLIISGMKRQSHPLGKPVTYYLFEREFGHFHKKIVIDFPVDPDQIRSVMENGLLKVTVPRRRAKPITIQTKK